MMTPRPLARMRMRRTAVGLTFAAAALLSLAGCDPRTLIFFLQPFDPVVPAAGPSLKGKKVVILTHATAGAQADFRGVDRELTRELIKLLRENTKRIEVVEPQKVWDWVDSHPSWSEPAEAAKAFDADIVIFLEVEQFQISDPSSPGLFKGVSGVHIQVTEMQHPKNSKGKPDTDKPKEPEVIYDQMCDTEFPTRGHMDASTGVSRNGFRNKFVKLVASEVSWHFVSHAPGDDIQDTKIY